MRSSRSPSSYPKYLADSAGKCACKIMQFNGLGNGVCPIGIEVFGWWLIVMCGTIKVSKTGPSAQDGVGGFVGGAGHVPEKIVKPPAGMRALIHGSNFIGCVIERTANPA